MRIKLITLAMTPIFRSGAYH